MHGDGYENGQVLLFYVFLYLVNQVFRLNYAQLICEPVRSDNKRLCIITVKIVLVFVS